MILKDKIVIVSGIGPGLGRELALGAAREGANLAIAARTASKLDEAEAAIYKLGLETEVLKVPTDITDSAQCQNLVNQTLARFGRIDSLLNSAFNPGSFDLIETANLRDWQQAFDVNLLGTLGLTQVVIPHMKARGGSIVMINTMATRKPMATQAGYASSKAALASATAHLAQELGKYNIRVNSTFMGWMWGPPVENYMRAMSQHSGQTVEEIRAQVEANIPLGKIPEDGDCAKAALFFASDYSSAITGAALDVNGGEYLPH